MWLDPHCQLNWVGGPNTILRSLYIPCALEDLMHIKIGGWNVHVCETQLVRDSRLVAAEQTAGGPSDRSKHAQEKGGLTFI